MFDALLETLAEMVERDASAVIPAPAMMAPVGSTITAPTGTSPRAPAAVAAASARAIGREEGKVMLLPSPSARAESRDGAPPAPQCIAIGLRHIDHCRRPANRAGIGQRLDKRLLPRRRPAVMAMILPRHRREVRQRGTILAVDWGSVAHGRAFSKSESETGQFIRILWGVGQWFVRGPFYIGEM